VRALGQCEPDLPTISPEPAGTAGYHTDAAAIAMAAMFSLPSSSASFEGSSEGGWVVSEVCARKGSVFMRQIPYL
jgi:hypothetical protein